MKKQSFVSVIMPVFNEQEFLSQAIESILTQTYKQYEFIIVDDLSTDSSAQIIKGYLGRYKGIVKAIFLKKHVGSNEARNIGFQKAKGRYIAIMDADDTAHPQRLEKQVEFLLRHPHVIVVGSQGYVVNNNNTIIGKKLFPLTHHDIYQQFGVFHPMLHPSCMIQRSLLPYFHKIYENVAGAHDDYFTFFSLLNYGDFANLPDILHFYRVHGKNISLQNPKERFYAIQKIRHDAVKNLSYRMPLKAIFLNMLQKVLVASIPESYILPMYLFYRGMYSSSQLFAFIRIRLPQISLFASAKV